MTKGTTIAKGVHRFTCTKSRERADGYTLYWFRGRYGVIGPFEHGEWEEWGYEVV